MSEMTKVQLMSLVELKPDRWMLPTLKYCITEVRYKDMLPYPVDCFGTGQFIPSKFDNLIDLRSRKVKISMFWENLLSTIEIMGIVSVNARETFVKSLLNPLPENGTLPKTIPYKPRSRFQKYVAVKYSRTISKEER